MVTSTKPLWQGRPARSMFTHIAKGAEERGMRVNDAKTNLICMPNERSYRATTRLAGRSREVINSTDKIKVLGVTID